MDLEQMRQAWQAQDEPVDLKVEADTLLQQVQTRHRELVRAVFWRDVREVGAAAAVAVFFVFVGVGSGQGAWFYYVAAGLALFVAAFILVDRVRQRREAARSVESIMDDLAVSLGQVEHQIWLLKNVLWWYLLPLGTAVGVVLFQAVWCAPYVSWLPGIELCLYALVFVLFLYLFVLFLHRVYCLNQRVVRQDLLPRREELAKLLSELRSANGEGNASPGRDDA